MVKKRGFWKNACLKQSNTLPMLTYLNRMSAKGLHAVGMSRFKNEFDQNKNVRYVYAVCNVHSEDYYREVGRWERVFEYKYPYEYISDTDYQKQKNAYNKITEFFCKE